VKQVKPTDRKDPKHRGRRAQAAVFGAILLFVLLIVVVLIQRPGGGWDVESWAHKEQIPAVGEITDREGAKFQNDFGLGPDLEREFEFRLTDGGRTKPAETQRRLKAFADFIKQNQDIFNRNPAEGVSMALGDPKAFGLQTFPIFGEKTYDKPPQKP